MQKLAADGRRPQKQLAASPPERAKQPLALFFQEQIQSLKNAPLARFQWV